MPDLRRPLPPPQWKWVSPSDFAVLFSFIVSVAINLVTNIAQNRVLFIGLIFVLGSLVYVVHKLEKRFEFHEELRQWRENYSRELTEYYAGLKPVFRKLLMATNLEIQRTNRDVLQFVVYRKDTQGQLLPIGAYQARDKAKVSFLVDDLWFDDAMNGKISIMTLNSQVLTEYFEDKNQYKFFKDINLVLTAPIYHPRDKENIIGTVAIYISSLSGNGGLSAHLRRPDTKKKIEQNNDCIALIFADNE